MRKFDISLSIIFSVFLILASLMIVFSFYGYHSNKSTIEDLLRSKAHTFIETLNHSSINTLLANELFEEEMILRLKNTCYYVNTMDSLGLLDRSMLDNITDNAKAFRINIFNSSGRRIMTNSRRGGGQFRGARYAGTSDIRSFIKSSKQIEVIGFKKARLEAQDRYAVAVKSHTGGAVVTVIDAKNILESRKKMGFGKLLQDIGSIKDIEYIVLQDNEGIIAATENIDEITRIESDPFLGNAFTNDDFFYRETEWQGNNILEIVHAFKTQGKILGIFRVGVSVNDIKILKRKLMQRILFSSFILILFSGILINYSTIKTQRKKILEQYKKLESDTQVVLEKMTEGIIVINKKKKINIFNNQASVIFEKPVEKVIGLEYSRLGTVCFDIIGSIFNQRKQYKNHEFKCSIKGTEKIFSLNSSCTENAAGEVEQAITIWNDITEKKKLEKQVQRQQQLNKIGELGSSIAHEIRNPLNAISVIVQRLKKEWLYSLKEEEPVKLVDTVLTEIKRINSTIEEFLRYAKPPGLNIKRIPVNDFIEPLLILMESQVFDSGLTFKNSGFDPAIVSIDSGQMRQVFINLIKNSIEATHNPGEISISGIKKDNNYIISISDTGTGIPPEIKDKIFDLYFSTKSSGSGIGLSIVHQIISQHNGVINVISESGNGTRFEIILNCEDQL